jgi:hypothetical protein
MFWVTVALYLIDLTQLPVSLQLSNPFNTLRFQLFLWISAVLFKLIRQKVSIRILKTSLMYCFSLIYLINHLCMFQSSYCSSSGAITIYIYIYIYIYVYIYTHTYIYTYVQQLVRVMLVRELFKIM